MKVESLITLSKKTFIFAFYYIMAILIAIFSVGILSLMFKVFLVTVQGPTTFTQISEIVTYYMTLSIASFLLFRSYGKGHLQNKPKTFFLFIALIPVFHAVQLIFVELPTIYLFKGSLQLAQFLYTNGGHLESIREIPRFYHLISIAIEDICFIVFSLFGYFKSRQQYPKAEHVIKRLDEK